MMETRSFCHSRFASPHRHRKPLARFNAPFRGYILLVVLVILVMLSAMTVTLTYAVSWRCLANSARTAQMQNQYAMDAALQIMSDQWSSGELKQQLLESGRIDQKIRLDDHVILVRIEDEATKLRIQQASAPGALAAAASLTSDIKGLDLQARAGTSDSWGVNAAQPWLAEDLFFMGIDAGDAFYGTPFSKQSAVLDWVTLWGDGRVNLFTASEQVIRLRFADQNPVVVESILAARRFTQSNSLDQLIDLMGLTAQDRQVVGARLVSGTTTLTVRLACQGPTQRYDGFAVMDVRGTRPGVTVWRDLPSDPAISLNDAPGNMPETDSLPSTFGASEGGGI